MIKCKYYVPVWKGNKNTNSEPDWRLKYGITLGGKCIKNCDCNHDYKGQKEKKRGR